MQHLSAVSMAFYGKLDASDGVSGIESGKNIRVNFEMERVMAPMVIQKTKLRIQLHEILTTQYLAVYTPHS
jgi:hypothetical protein